MDEQALLQRLSVDTHVNIELLRALLHNHEIRALVAANKLNEAVVKIRAIDPSVGLGQAKIIVAEFSVESK
jgi:hypothetical protein